MNGQDDLLEYYRRELAYLRTQSADFAARYPKVARHLRLADGEAADPHTEHLIESVAFLTARVHRDLDRDLPDVAAAMLDSLCPHLTRPVPAMTVMQLTLDPGEGKVTAGMRVRRGTLLSATATTGERCAFRVGWDATLWPLRVAAVVQEEPRTLRLDFCTDGGMDVAELELDTLRLHLAGDLLTTMPLHEMLAGALQHVELVGGGTVHRLGAGALTEAGYAEDEALLCQPGHGHPAYGLLQEYFAFPRKFQFFDLRGLRGRLGHGTGFSVRLVFAYSAPVLAVLGPAHVLTNCVPAVNLFPVTSEPIAYDRRHHEYLLVPDRRRDAVLEVHTVLAVTASSPLQERTETIPNAFADGDTAPLGWTMRRETSLRKGIAGTDVYLAFVDRQDVRAALTEPVMYAELLCTNRQLADHVAPGTRFYGDGIATSTVIRALYQPSAQRAPALGTKALWALVALMRLNHHSLVDGTAGVQTLQRMLLLFAGGGARDQVQIRGIASLRAASAMARLGTDTWRGHCRGTDIELEFDADAFAGTSPLVLAGVLARFFALYTTANSFVRLAVVRRGELWKQWPALTGRQCLI
ncbi:type VI secretion system protein ImpG [Pseudoduganella flava]|uniref:Type VI secretion system baseplate subunit TssF n=1 Tax=Pseudoduganella flava TaxID=871742 RepID=A0A562PHA0_9BURK|nr:type VI secretion system baseplate subunit TssF [Pseudoduganella flava]QGZ42660.1 type VI secretion system baseplate subunit TssF [Pseudoduganella flava]TWI43821.1 type VI secretion system protein ImpG [Pseudoduganella flava]